MSRLAWAWLVLVLGGAGEVLWAAMLNRAQGFNHPEWLIGGLLVSLVSVAMLGWAMRLIDLGTGYAAWIGIGAIGSVVVGIAVFGESTHPLRLVFIGCVIVGIVGLRFTEGEAPPPPEDVEHPVG
jgi:quaternary ammonium compound-resistance protein SugE